MIELLMRVEPKDWLLLGLGSLGTVIAFLFKTLRVFLQTYGQITPLLGTWHTYHWSRANHRPVFRYTQFVFSRSLRGIRLDVLDDKQTTLPYRGTVTFEAGQIVIQCEGVSHEETWQLRLNSPIPHEDTIMIGIELMQDFDRQMLATTKLCCQKKRTEADAKQLVSAYTRLTEADCALRLGDGQLPALDAA
jgi:hypothetical protein